MDDNPEILLKKLCCTCLSKNRKLFQLCRLNDGVNNLYSLLSSDSEAYREGFYKDTANLFICWECTAIMCRISSFRKQACIAQKQLSSITDGKTDIKDLKTCLSRLSQHHKSTYDHTIISDDLSDLHHSGDCAPVIDSIKTESDDMDIPLSELHDVSDHEIYLSDNCLEKSDPKISKNIYNEIVVLENSKDALHHDNFVDCGPVIDSIKTECDDLEDIPLSKLHNNCMNKNEPYAEGKNIIDLNDDLRPFEKRLRKHINVESKSIKKKKAKVKLKGNESFCDRNKKYFTTTTMNEEEMFECREKRKLSVGYADAVFKCESCIEGFKVKSDLDRHNLAVHIEKDKQVQCDLCLSYMRPSALEKHRGDHFLKHECHFCDYTSYNLMEMLKHLKNGHAMQNLVVPVERKKGQRKTPEVLKPGSKPRRNQAMMDKRTPFGYLCTECNKYFDNKNQRWKHVQRYHREGFKCATCGKRFAFKNNLSRHEQLHQGPPPREECQICHKMIRVDLVKIHARIHSNREKFTCIECQKCFVSRASYEHHLKYTQAHAAVDILKYKCSMCDKGYRSRGELRDHVNYQHMGKTQHKCPVCGKALATRRCITRHVRRAHHGLKESARDKICQQCGKAFRDKKGLREHEFIHTGERPLSCEICGCTFRQSASLYTHRKRVHHIYPRRKSVTLLDDDEQSKV